MDHSLKTNETRDRCAGLSSVEAAIFAPLLFLLIFGVLEYSWAFLKIQQVNGAARRCARMGIIEGATVAELMAEVDQLMIDASLAGSGYTVTLTPPDPATLAPGEILRVDISVPYANIDLFGIPLIPTPANLVASTSMAIETPR